MLFEYYLVGGTFDDEDGRPSGYIEKLYKVMRAINPHGHLWNGGSFKQLKHDTDVYFHDTEKVRSQSFNGVIFWFPDVPNDKEKLVRELKKSCPSAFLITSKNNLDGKYPFIELVTRALQTKANLFVEFKRDEESKKLLANVCDPLGNQFCSSIDIEKVATTLMVRVFELMKFTRIPSREKDDWLDNSILIEETQDLKRFFNAIKKHAERFHKCIHGTDTTRLLGNASFRCENGFPSFKDQSGQVYVSKRNIDKRDIGLTGFVPVCFSTISNVLYKGKNKPSVDTPVQLMLYDYYRNIRYMLHSHTYIEGREFTSRLVPCGAIEEFFEIVKLYPSRDTEKILINLRGHGSLVMLSTLDFKIFVYPGTQSIEDIAYMPRSLPEKA